MAVFAKDIWGTAPKRVTKSMTESFGSYNKNKKLAGGWKMPSQFRKAFDGRSNKIFG
ncbi:unnamed protein product, partial [marine sediment metagenome]